MRSRFTAYVQNDVEYLLQSWQRNFRPADLKLDQDIRWLGLEIIDFSEQGDAAQVEFEALLLADGRIDAMHENSRFVREAGQWLYTDGEMMVPRAESYKPARNQPCPCGSGKKFKRCCGQ